MGRFRTAKTWMGIVLLCACVLACAVTLSHAQMVEGIAAVVNDEAITYGDISERAASAVAEIEAGLPSDQRQEQMALLHLAALRTIVEEKLLQAEGAQQDNEAFDKQVNQILESQLENDRRISGGAVAFRRKIAEENLTYSEYVKNIRAKVIAEAMVQNMVRRNLSVSPAETREYYRKHTDEFTKPGTTTYRQIFINADKYPSRAEARKAAENVTALLAEGHDFAALAVEKSDGPRAKDGGLWEPAQEGLRPKVIEDLIFSLSPGTFSEPAETDVGFTIVKVEKRTPEHITGYAETQEQIRNQILYQKQIKRYEDLLQRLEAKNYVRLQ